MDIRPPKKRPVVQARPQLPRPAPSELPPIVGQQPAPPPVELRASPAPKKKRKWLWSLVGVALTILLIAGGLVAWYQASLGPVDPQATDKIRLIIKQGDTADMIASKLKHAGLIRSGFVFRVYTELSHTKDQLQAGGYALSRSLSVADIVDHLSSGKTDEFNVRISPGLTLKQLADPAVKGSLVAQGFSSEEVKAAFAKKYNHPLLKNKPANASLEGYIYPETYRVAADTSVESLVEVALDEFHSVIQETGLMKKLAARKLNLHQAVTLASIIQKEVSTEGDQRQVSQVFHKRLAEGIALQSDPTFIYPARQAGQEPSVEYKSPYNTYLHTGLPPGPISTFNLSALEAVASPAKGDFLYFVADKEGATHFSKTLEEHEAKVKQYCTDHCNDF